MSDYYNPVAACMIRNRTKEREMRDELKDRAIALLKDTWAQGYESGVKATNIDCGVVWEERIDVIKAEIDSHCSDNRDRNDGLYIAMKIIDKHCGGDAGE